MKNIFLFFFLFIVLNIEDTEQKRYTRGKIDEIVKNIEIISNTIDCDTDTLEQELKIFGLDENKKNELCSQLINVCNLSKNEDKELFIRAMYEYFKSELKENEIHSPRRSQEPKPENGLSTYLCKKIMILLGYDSFEC